MGIASVEEMWPGRQGTQDYQRGRSYDRVFEVYTQYSTDDASIVLLAAGLPAMWSPYPYDPFAKLTKKAPSQDEADPLRWIVTCSYESMPGQRPDKYKKTQPDGSAPDSTDNPLDEPPEWKVDYQEYHRPLWQAFDIVGYMGNPVLAGQLQGQNVPFTTVAPLNSAGDPFDPPLEWEDSDMIITITFNQPTVDFAALSQIHNTVNVKPWKGLGVHQCKLFVSAASAIKNNVPYWRYSLRIVVRWVTWDLQPLDCGYTHLKVIGNDGSNNPIVQKHPILMGPHPLTSPVPLDGKGHVLPLGAAPVFLRYGAHRECDFNAVIPW